MIFRLSEDRRRILLLCQCGRCDTPWMEVRIPQAPGRDALAVVNARHNGEHHPNVLTLSDLARLVAEAASMGLEV